MTSLRIISPERPAFTVLLGLLAGLPALSIDISSPTLVELPAALATTPLVAGLTLSLFMVGFALGLVIAGSVSDRTGRRPVLLASLALFMAAGLLCTLAWSGPSLVAARLIQGAGAGGCAVLASAMVQDAFEGEVARRKRSYITVILGIVPVLAPALGVALSTVWGWRAVHAVLVLGGLILTGAALLCGETRRPTAKPGRPKPLPLWEDRRFLIVAIVNAASYGAVFAYIAGAPAIIMSVLGFSPNAYAGIFAGTALALSAGAWTSARLGRRGVGAGGLIWPALALQAAAGVALALCGSVPMPGPALLTPLLLFAFARGLAAPNLMHAGLQLRQRDAGVASAVIGVVQLLTAAAASGVVAATLPRLHMLAATGVMAALAGSAALAWLTLGRRRGAVADPL